MERAALVSEGVRALGPEKLSISDSAYNLGRDPKGPRRVVERIEYSSVEFPMA